MQLFKKACDTTEAIFSLWWSGEKFMLFNS